LLASAEEFQDEMLDELRSMPVKKKTKHWLREIIETLLS